MLSPLTSAHTLVSISVSLPVDRHLERIDVQRVGYLGNMWSGSPLINVGRYLGELYAAAGFDRRIKLIPSSAIICSSEMYGPGFVRFRHISSEMVLGAVFGAC